MSRLWQPLARRASAQCALALGPQHLHYQPMAYITVRWGEFALCTHNFTGTSRSPPWERLRRGIYFCVMPLTCIFSCAASMEWRKLLFPPSTAHSLRLHLSCAVQFTAAPSTRTLTVKYSGPNSLGSTPRGQMEEFLNPFARIF